MFERTEIDSHDSSRWHQCSASVLRVCPARLGHPHRTQIDESLYVVGGVTELTHDGFGVLTQIRGRLGRFVHRAEVHNALVAPVLAEVRMEGFDGDFRTAFGG